MPGHRWRSTAADWLRSAADILSPAAEASAPDHGHHGGEYSARGPGRAAGRTFNLGGAPEHWVKLLRDAGLATGEPAVATPPVGSPGVGTPGPARPAAPEEAASPVPAPRPGDSSAARSPRAVAADAGPATGTRQAAPDDGSGAGGRRPRAAADLRIPRLLIGRRAAGSQPASRKTGTQATPNQQGTDPQDPAPGSGVAPPASGTPGHASHTRSRSARRADPAPASGSYQPVTRLLPGTPAQLIPAQPEEPAQPQVPPPTGHAGLPVMPGPRARAHPAVTRPPAEGTVRYPGRAAVGTLPPRQPPPTVPFDPGPATSTHPLERAGMQYAVPGPEQPATDLGPALAGEWPELPPSAAAPATAAVPERVEQTLTRNFRLRDEQGAV